MNVMSLGMPIFKETIRFSAGNTAVIASAQQAYDVLRKPNPPLQAILATNPDGSPQVELMNAYPQAAFDLVCLSLKSPDLKAQAHQILDGLPGFENPQQIVQDDIPPGVSYRIYNWGKVMIFPLPNDPPADLFKGH